MKNLHRRELQKAKYILFLLSNWKPHSPLIKFKSIGSINPAYCPINPNIKDIDLFLILIIYVKEQ